MFGSPHFQLLRQLFGRPPQWQEKQYQRLPPFSLHHSPTTPHTEAKKHLAAQTRVSFGSGRTSKYSSPAKFSFTKSQRAASNMSNINERVDAPSDRSRRKSFSPAAILSSTFHGSPRARSGLSLSGHRSRHTQRRSRGKLSAQLESIQDAVEGDLLRFRSGQYPFRLNNGHDHSDPRNRASSVMDVTIVSDPTDRNQLRKHSTMLAYVHSFTVEEADPLENATVSLHPRSEFVWICFKEETLREHDIGKNMSMRLYNVVPTRLGVDGASSVFALPSVDPELDAVSTGPLEGAWLILCTEICERYPLALPKLFPVPKVPCVACECSK